MVLFEDSLRARYVNISIKPFQGVRVAVPRKVSLKKAERFVEEKRNWIQKHVQQFKSKEKEYQVVLSEFKHYPKNNAKIKIKARLKVLAELHGFSYNKISIRCQKTRWGSCSGKNNISLNIKLVLLPEIYIDYVIFHELVHTLIKNHSSEFWMELNKYVGNAKAMRSKLNDIGSFML